jgi:hypothetical protein
MAKKNEVAEKKDVQNNYSMPEKKVKIDRILVENFVSLQKVMTNLAVKFDNLSNQISRLLELFEISAKTLAEKDYSKKEDNKKVIEKLDALLEHNKIIAKGIALLHEKGMPEEKEVVIMPQQQIQPAPIAREPMPLRQNIPRMPAQQQMMPRMVEPEKQYIKPSQEFSKVRYTEE